ncbi:MAG: DUF5916 domain-containing protein [Chitinophagaceae bacterium]
MYKIVVNIVTFLFCCAYLQAQPKNIRAVKISQPLRIDGILDEAVWNLAPIATDFTTNTPVFGNPASFKTEVKVLYDNTSIYIAAYIYDDAAKIRRQFTPRDQELRADVDYFSVFIDTYRDRQNAFQFLVTSRNVQSDTRVSPQAQTDFGVYGDVSWDAVWESRVAIKNDGWVVEMKIPYFSIRFSKQNEQDWGIQFMRFSRRLNETSFWNPVDPNVNGFANQFGDVSGLQNLVPPLRLSLSPYISGGFRGSPTLVNGIKGYSNEWLPSGGLDIKYGLNESFTLDATLIPDFGQVISDNVVNNISPFEIQFRENRPFFTEGTELFNKSQIFYSRRVGAVPSRYSEIKEEVENGSLTNYRIDKNPSVTRLYNAIKFSGRTRNNLGIGVFNAIAQPVRALLKNKINGRDSSILTEPLTNYNVIVFDQALKNRSYITLTNTNVLRNGTERDANVTAIDIALYDKKNKFGLILAPRYTNIFDNNGGYDGFSNYFELGKVSGKFRYSITNRLKSDQYDPNDLGFNLSPNEFSTQLNTSYNIFEATPKFLNQRYSFSVNQSYLYNQFDYQKTTLEASAFLVFKNFWDVTAKTEVQPVWYNDFFELRTPLSNVESPRKKLRKPANFFIGISGSSDSRKQLFINWDIGFAESPLPNDPYYSIEIGSRYRFGDRFTLSLSFLGRQDNGQFGYSLSDPTLNETVLARRRYTDVTTIFSGTYNFTSRMNISFRGRHFWNKIENSNLYRVLPDGNWVERLDLIARNYNVNYNAFNLDLFFTWDFRLGSRIVLGWKNWLGTDYDTYINGTVFPGYLDNAKQIFYTPHGNEVTLRFIYFLNYNQFLRKK